MERRNVTLNDETMQAADYLKEQYHIASTSAAIRYAVMELAKRAGWKPESKRRRTPTSRQGDGEGGRA